MFSWQKFDNWHGGQALCFAHKIPTQMCTEQILAISGSFACIKSRQWSACCPVECKPWACNKISNFTRGLTFIINDLHFHAMCILEIFNSKPYFYQTRIRSLAMLVTHWLTDWLTNSLPFSKLDWSDPGVWRCQLKTCWGCYCYQCWWWGSFWQQFAAHLEAEVWS